MVIHSFDIFDTCLFRSCGIPKNVFDLLGMDILKKDKIDEDVRYFSLIRSQGEIKARRKNTNKEFTLE